MKDDKDNLMPIDIPTEQLEFNKKDYELKINYLSNHFTRMWNRFNFFLVLEAGISAALWVWLKEKGGFIPQAPALAWVGLVSGLVWYAFGAQDRYLVEVYRNQVEAAGKEIATQLALKDYVSVGSEDIALNQKLYEYLYQWRIELISPTRLAAWFPLLVLLYWVYMIVLTSTTLAPVTVVR
jgi:hypothetical protein